MEASEKEFSEKLDWVNENHPTDGGQGFTGVSDGDT